MGLDLMGFGKSETPELARMNQAGVDDLKTFAAASGFHNITLAMHDWGGMVEMDLPTRQLKPVRGLASVITALLFEHGEDNDLQMKADPSRDKSPGFGKVIAKLGRQVA